MTAFGFAVMELEYFVGPTRFLGLALEEVRE